MLRILGFWGKYFYWISSKYFYSLPHLELVCGPAGVAEDGHHDAVVVVAADQVALEALYELALYELAPDGHLEVRVDVGDLVPRQLALLVHLAHRVAAVVVGPLPGYQDTYIYYMHNKPTCQYQPLSTPR